MVDKLGTRRDLAVLMLIGVLAIAGCETGGQSGALGGAAIGALAGQLIGGDTEATLIGAAAGAGIGYVIGNEQDKKKAKEMSQSSQPVHTSGSTHYAHEDVGELGGTRWAVISLVPKDVVPAYASKIIEFRPDGRVITTTTLKDGTVNVDSEDYRVVGSTLIVNKPGYLINARFSVSGDQLIVDAEEFRAVLKRLVA